MLSMLFFVYYVPLFSYKASRDGWLVGYSRRIGHGLGSDATDEF